MRRRTILAAGAASLLAGPAFAAPWPERPVRLVTPYAPGGPLDLAARLTADKLAARFGQSFVVDNKPGANGAIGVQAVLAAPPDGYTLLIHGSAGTTIYPAVMRQPAFDTLRDLVPITLIVYFDLILCANPQMPFSTVKEFVAYTKANPGKLSYGSAGVGAMNHVGAEWFKMMTGIDIVHVPYRGFPAAVTDLVGGQIQTMFAIASGVLPQIEAGKMKGIAITAEKRWPTAPNVPTLGELGYPGAESYAWIGLLAPAKTPPEIIARLNAATLKALAAPEQRQGLEKQGFEVVGGGADAFDKYRHAEAERWGDVIKRTGAKVE
jgi:tripartite-type tricarboxylate transporter receptor subunit TctC